MKREVRLFDELDRFAGGGEITHALALTFGYDGDTAAERIWTPLIEKYGVRHPLVIADGVVHEGTALGVHVLRGRRHAGVFHPKLFLAVREDAVFAAVGSANLTRGGLGANLELLTPLVFAKDAERPPPRAVLQSILAFVDRVATDLTGRIVESSRERILEVLEHARLAIEGLPEPRRAPDLRFLHSYEAPLWNQLVALHGDDPVTHLAVVSPFFEIDDPELDESDSLLRFALGEGLRWAPRAKSPRCTLHVTALGTVMPLPRSALEELGAAVEVHPQALSIEPRRLHAKLIAVFGKKRTTLLWGSPNFTPSALLRPAAWGGNVECALALSTSATNAGAEEIFEEFDLGEVFHLHRGPLPETRVTPPQPPLVFEIGEALYDQVTRKLTVCGDAWNGHIRRLVLLVDTGAGAVVLAESALAGPGTFTFEVDAGQLEQLDPETGKRRLRTHALLFEAFDESGHALGGTKVRLNVRFEDALEVHNNLLLGADALSADALLVPSSAPPEQRVAALDGLIALWKAVQRGDRTAVVRHQASLDGFFRNVRRGLDARWEVLERRKGSRFALLRWSHDLRRSLAAAGAASLEGVRRTYLVARVAEHIERVMAAVPEWHEDPGPAYAVIEAEKLALMLASASPADGVRAETLHEAQATCARAIEALERIAARNAKVGQRKQKGG
jgi:hypothetical protein